MVQMPATENYVALKDGNVFYLNQGQGPPLVLLHPSSQSSWVWHKVLGALSQFFQCFALDMPGYGRSDVPPDGYSIGRYSEAVIEFMDKVGITKAHLMGQRTGAMVSFDLAAYYPDRFDKLILVSCPAWTKEEGLLILERLRKPMMDEHGVLQPQPYELLVAGEPYLDRAWADRETEAVRAHGEWCTSTQWATNSYDMADVSKARQIKAPTLIIYGEQDVLRKKDRLNSNIPDSRLKIFPDCGIPNYQMPDAFAREVTDFLRR